MVDEQGQDHGRNDEKLDSERVMLTIVRGLELDIHQIERAKRGGQVEDLHHRVVQRDEVGEQVQVAGEKDEREQDLTATRNARARSGLPDLGEQDENRTQMGQIAD
jgi:hypothetical protein